MSAERPLTRTERLQLLAVLVIFLLAALLEGCATTRPAVTVEAPRDLAPAADHVYREPVHAGTDLTQGFQAIDTDEAPAATVDAGGAAEAPEVATKAGLKMGEVR